MQLEQRWNTTREEPVPRPATRRLRGYAFDPSLSTQMDTAMVNQIVFRIPWEEDAKRLHPPPGSPVDADAGLSPGPVGEYVEVIDYDPASGCFYEPVDLNSAHVLAQDGLVPSEGNPQFHQQMVYAVAMTTIRNFERALGRFALWAPSAGGGDDFIRRLRIYPHALREANAYYSPQKRALLFGYFPADELIGEGHFPGGLVFTCLSHDITAHETTHALLDGMHRRFLEPNHPDALAFHEAFADIVALFQHFSFADVLRHQIAKTRGDLTSENELGRLAQQFGVAIGKHGALRDAIGGADKDGNWTLTKPSADEINRVFEPHARGAILVAAVFDAFLAIYRRRVADLFRVASSGTGVMPEGALHPDLVNRLAREATKAAQHVLNMCIRALDYCPPIDITFGDYLRAMITADSDLVPDDDLNYRVAFIEAFRRRGIYPTDIRTLSVDSLRWPVASRGDSSEDDLRRLRDFAMKLKSHLALLRDFATTRAEYHRRSRDLAEKLHTAAQAELADDLEFVSRHALALQGALPGLELDAQGRPKFEVHSVRAARRVGPDGDTLNHAIIVITQKRILPLVDSPVAGPTFKYRGGCTLILNLDTLDVQYAIGKAIGDEQRLARTREFRRTGGPLAMRSTYRGGALAADDEPFALLHRGGGEVQP